MERRIDQTIERNEKLVGKKFWEFFFPSILMSASTSLSIIIDSIIVGNVLGADELAAMNLIMPLSLCFTALSAMFGIGASNCIPVFKGEMDHDNANKCLTLSCIAWAVCSIAVFGLGLFASEPVAAFLSGNSGLTHHVEAYLKVYLIGAPFTFITMIFPYIIKSDGKPKLSSAGLIVANVLNLILDVVFMKYMGMGLEGGALASITGYAVGSSLYLIYVFSKNRTVHLTKVRGADLKLYHQMFRMSISSIFGQGLMFAKIWIFNMIVATVAGQAGLTAFSVCTSCLSFVSMFIAGGAQTMMPMVAAFKGSKDHTAIKLTIRKTLKIIIGCCLIVTLIFELFPETIMAIYGVTGGEALQIGITAVRLFSIALTGIGFSFLFMYYVQASGRASFSMQICALEGFCIIVPAALLMAWLAGSQGFWLSYTVNEILVMMFIVAKARHIVKKSDGALESLFMVERTDPDALELSVDVSDDKAIRQACRLIAEVGKDAAGDTEGLDEVIRYMLQLSQQGYEAKTGLKKGDMADIILQKKKISMKDMGIDYQMLENNCLLEKIHKMDFPYEHTLMIGLNFTVIERTEEQ